jgi:hypothetical protein
MYSKPQMPTHRLPEELSSELRYFAFFIGNSALEPIDCPSEAFDYDQVLNQPSPLLGELFTIYLNIDQAYREGRVPHRPQERAAQYLAAYCLPTYAPTSPFAAWELLASDKSLNSIETLKTFASLIGQGTLVPELLEPINYFPFVVMYGSFLEQVVAIFSNVLELDQFGQVRNTTHAQWRAAQYIRQYCDPTYQVIPPFEAWETELL